MHGSFPPGGNSYSGFCLTMTQLRHPEIPTTTVFAERPKRSHHLYNVLRYHIISSSPGKVRPSYESTKSLSTSPCGPGWGTPTVINPLCRSARPSGSLGNNHSGRVKPRNYSTTCGLWGASLVRDLALQFLKAQSANNVAKQEVTKIGPGTCWPYSMACQIGKHTFRTIAGIAGTDEK